MSVECGPWCSLKRLGSEKVNATRSPNASTSSTDMLAESTSSSVESWRQLYKIGLPGKSILGDYFQENRTSRRPFLLLRISFPGRPILIQLVPDRRRRGRPWSRLPPLGWRRGGRARTRRSRRTPWGVIQWWRPLIKQLDIF